MSETTPHTPDGTCELLLDYVYGELDEARKRTFEEHLPGCARCQQEMASFGRVRTATKRLLPSVEPTAPLAGPLHAQLMHAAAQRKPRRGVLLAFPRKIVQHPALSAAAMFVLVGGAFAINWSRGKLAMPAAERQDVDVAKSNEVAAATPTTPAPVATAEPMAEGAPAAPAAGEAKLADRKLAGKKSAAKNEAQPDSQLTLATDKSDRLRYKGGDKAAAADDQTRIALETPSGNMTVQRPAPHRATSGAAPAPSVPKVATAAPKSDAPAKMKKIAVDGKAAKLDDALAKDEESGNGLGSVNGAAGPKGGATGTVSGGVVGGGGVGRGAIAENAKSSAPQELNVKPAEKAPARESQTSHGYATSLPAQPQPQASTLAKEQRSYDSRNAPTASPPPASPVPSAAVSSSSSERDGTYGRMQQQAVTTVQKPAAPRNLELLRKQADELAKTGRCDEAIKAYEELDKSGLRISPTERAGWIRCLAQKGRQEEAQQRLDELKAGKGATNTQIQEAEKSLNETRRRAESSKKAKKAAPADRAPQQTQQRVSEPPPAQAAPPDSTNTKVTKPAL